MKLLVKQLRKLIREVFLLVEVTCPSCGNPDAYVGMSAVECPNKKCPHYSQKQADDVKASRMKKGQSGDLGVLLDYAGLYGLEAEGGEVSYEAVRKLQSDYGFVDMSDFGVGTGGTVSPKHWKVVEGPDDAADPNDVILAGTYDEIFWEAVSPEAKNLAHEINDPAKNPNPGADLEFYDDDGNVITLDRGHLFDIFRPEPPFDEEKINELLGVEGDKW